MKSLQDHLTEYVAARRALGTRLEEPAKTLRHFTQFLARRKARFITIQLALEWSQQSQGVQRATWARKLSMVRQFARWMSVIEPRHQVPPRRLLDVRHRRSKPHIYSDDEITQLMAEAAQLRSSNGMKALTLETLIGLLASTGLRPGEAAALTVGDVDLRSQVLIIRVASAGVRRPGKFVWHRGGLSRGGYVLVWLASHSVEAVAELFSQGADEFLRVATDQIGMAMNLHEFSLLSKGCVEAL